MNDNLVCNVCATPGTFAGSREQGRVRSNVRAFRQESFTLWRCNSCESLHCKETVDLAHYYRSYFEHESKEELFRRCVFHNRLRQLQRANWTKRHSVLDYGCASGLFVRYLQRSGVPATGYDPYASEWSAPDRLKETYDVVTTYDVIEHDEDPRAWLVRVSQLVRSGGRLFVSTPDAAKFAIDAYQDWMPYAHVPYHRHILSARALTQLGESLGLRVRLVEHVDFLDTLLPAVNNRFVLNYVRACGGCIDVVTEPPRIGAILKTPSLWFDAILGSFRPYGINMTVVFDKP